eukprot:769817-Amphidinium_carterae.1
MSSKQQRGRFEPWSEEAGCASTVSGVDGGLAVPFKPRDYTTSPTKVVYATAVFGLAHCFPRNA